MADIQGVARGVLAVARDIAPLLVPGVPAAITAGQALISLINSTKSIAFSRETEAELDAARVEIEARINAKADRVKDKLADPPS